MRKIVVVVIAALSVSFAMQKETTDELRQLDGRERLDSPPTKSERLHSSHNTKRMLSHDAIQDSGVDHQITADAASALHAQSFIQLDDDENDKNAKNDNDGKDNNDEEKNDKEVQQQQKSDKNEDDDNDDNKNVDDNEDSENKNDEKIDASSKGKEGCCACPTSDGNSDDDKQDDNKSEGDKADVDGVKSDGDAEKRDDEKSDGDKTDKSDGDNSDEMNSLGEAISAEDSVDSADDSKKEDSADPEDDSQKKDSADDSKKQDSADSADDSKKKEDKEDSADDSKSSTSSTDTDASSCCVCHKAKEVQLKFIGAAPTEAKLVKFQKDLAKAVGQALKIDDVKVSVEPSPPHEEMNLGEEVDLGPGEGMSAGSRHTHVTTIIIPPGDDNKNTMQLVKTLKRVISDPTSAVAMNPVMLHFIKSAGLR